MENQMTENILPAAENSANQLTFQVKSINNAETNIQF